jgi:hypothetical protein
MQKGRAIEGAASCIGEERPEGQGRDSTIPSRVDSNFLVSE